MKRLLISILLIFSISHAISKELYSMADSLYRVAVEYFKQGDTDKAVELFIKVDSLNIKGHRQEPYLLNNAEHWIQYIQLTKGEIESHEYKYPAKFIPYDRELLQDIYQDYINIDKLLDEQDNQGIIFSCSKVILPYCENILGASHYTSIHVRIIMGDSYMRMAEWSLAENEYTKAAQYIKEQYDYFYWDYANMLYNLSEAFFKQQDIASAYVCCRESNVLFSFLDSEAAETVNKRLSDMETDINENLYTEDFIYNCIGIAESLLPIDNFVLADLYLSLGNLYASNDKTYENSITAYNKALNIIKARYGVCIDAALVCHDIAGLYGALLKYTQAIHYERTAINIMKRLDYKTSQEYVDATNSLAYYLGKSGDTGNGYEQSLSSMKQLNNVLEQFSAGFAATKDTLLLIQEFRNLMELFEYTNITMLNNNLTYILDHPSALGELDTFMNLMQKYNSVIVACITSLEKNTNADFVKYKSIFEDIKRILYNIHADIASHIARIYNYYGKYDEAYSALIPLDTKQLDDSSYRAISWLLGIIEYNRNNFREAIAHYENGCDSTIEQFAVYTGIAKCFANIPDCRDSTLNYLQKAMPLFKRYIANKYRYLSNDQRINNWKYDIIDLSDYINCMVKTNGTNGIINGIAYDAILCRKSLLSGFDSYIDELYSSVDDTTKDYIDELFHIENLLSASNKNVMIPIDSIKILEKRKNEIEAIIIESSAEYGEFLKQDLSVTYQQIRSSLREHEIAIEFIEDYSDLKRQYSALILRKEWEYPQYIQLGEYEDYIKHVSDLYFPYDLTNIIWSDIIIRAEISEGESIYFSTDGLLHQIPIEYLPDKKGRPLSETYNMFRVSSTKELTERQTERNIRNAVLYGGLKYDTSETKQDNASIQPDSIYAENNFRTIQVEFERIRSGIKELPHTLTEIENIGSTLDRYGIDKRIH